MGKLFLAKLLLLVALLFPSLSYSELIVTCKSKESTRDKRYEYDHSLIMLALEKTREEFGSYKLLFSGKMDSKRAQLCVEHNYLTNFVYKGTVTTKRLKEFGYIPFPVDRGIVGYRVAFTNPATMKRLEALKTLDDLKKIPILQKKGWTDVEILTYNSFEIALGTDYQQLFHMVAQGRAPLFMRGANELMTEWASHKHIEGLKYDTTFALYYPLPRFFFTHKSNTAVIKRLTAGLKLAYEDGSLVKLWEEHYRESIQDVNLKNRRIFKVENPLIKGLDDEYMKYIYDPLQDNSK